MIENSFRWARRPLSGRRRKKGRKRFAIAVRPRHQAGKRGKGRDRLLPIKKNSGPLRTITKGREICLEHDKLVRGDLFSWREAADQSGADKKKGGEESRYPTADRPSGKG